MYILHELHADIQPLSLSKRKYKTENIQVLTSVFRKSYKNIGCKPNVRPNQLSSMPSSFWKEFILSSGQFTSTEDVPTPSPIHLGLAKSNQSQLSGELCADGSDGRHWQSRYSACKTQYQELHPGGKSKLFFHLVLARYWAQRGMLTLS